MSDLRDSFGTAVRLRRDVLGLSQEELAHASGLHRTYLSGVERGQRNISIDNIARLASALDAPPSALFTVAERQAV